MRNSFPDQYQIVLEVREGVVADLETLKWLRAHLQEIGIGLAYDDFGSGPARLTELVEIPPDFIKLDKSLVRNIDHCTARQELVQALNAVIANRGVHTIAEGIERPEEAEVCQRLGCRFGQGFHMGRPQPFAVLGLEEEATAFVRSPHG